MLDDYSGGIYNEFLDDYGLVYDFLEIYGYYCYADWSKVGGGKQ